MDQHRVPLLAARGPDTETVQRVGGSVRREVRGLGDDGPHGFGARSGGAAWLRRYTAALPDWCAEAETASKAYGEAWQQKKQSLILIVPSVVARIEKNILINPEHAEFGKISASLHQPVWWDKRLFAD